MRFTVDKVIATIRLAVTLFAVIGIGSCGGGGGGSGDSGGSKLFVADSGTHAIGSVSNSNPSPGNISVDRIITGTSSNGMVGEIPALLLDVARNRLYVSTELSIIVFNNAATANGALDYNRRVATIPGNGNFNSMALDSARDFLYVGDLSTGVQVYHNASTTQEVGAATNLPTRTISFPGVGPTLSVRDIALDPVKDILYVAAGTPTGGGGTLTMAILVFDAASTLNGMRPPNRTITIQTSSGGTMGLFIDTTHDRLYFADPGGGLGGGVSIYENASTRNDPAVTPEKSVLLPSTILRLAVDTVNDRLYAAGSSALYVVPNISTAPAGPVNATAALAGPGSRFTAVAVRP